jgi:hypothetical protein
MFGRSQFPCLPDVLLFSVGTSGEIIQTVKYADDLVLMAKEETVLQGMIDKLIETGRCYGMEMNVEQTMEGVLAKLNPGLPWQSCI